MKEMKALREKHLAYVADNLSYFNDCKTSFAISECKSWINKIFDDVEAELEEQQRLKYASIEEIEYALSKPEYASVYLNNALRFLKDSA